MNNSLAGYHFLPYNYTILSLFIKYITLNPGGSHPAAGVANRGSRTMGKGAFGMGAAEVLNRMIKDRPAEVPGL
ncbi:hypothetical protein [Niabella drilacis]|uniref:Uncharacterized protein n=1 Tax=Niabella drilacis (strain DSM 25811 / CCM 8410 / CCUG 62505 / LMG 26954 / E90) TaxID=1285928 RepID=A0A1G6TR45_NIADE|nr:hypothetical protein [Niabella drilacis]SDD31573.1 hypothetical protein SAMN04487894_1082 [Niabella drilacis]